MRLVEETEAHVLVRLLLLLLLGGGSGLLSGSSTTSGGSGGTSGSTTGGDGSELLGTLGDQLQNVLASCSSWQNVVSSYLLDVLALELSNELVKALRVGLNTNGLKDSLDVGSRGAGVATKTEEEVGRKVLHFFGCCAKLALVPEQPMLAARAALEERDVLLEEVKIEQAFNRFSRFGGD